VQVNHVVGFFHDLLRHRPRRVLGLRSVGMEVMVQSSVAALQLQAAIGTSAAGAISALTPGTPADVHEFAERGPISDDAKVMIIPR